MDEILITSVFKREPLWNPANEFYRNIPVLKQLWEEVAVEVKKDVETARAKWKNLRRYFFKVCEKNERMSGDGADKIYKTKWKYFDQMLFLLKCKKNQSENAAGDSNSSTDNDDYKLQNPSSVQTSETITSDTLECHSYYSQTSQTEKIPLNRAENNDHYDQLLEIEKLKILQRESSKEKSDDLLFFESLLPYLENIPLRRKLWLRSKIQELILAEIEDLENNIQQPVSLETRVKIENSRINFGIN